MHHKASPEDQAYLSSFFDFTVDPESFNHRNHIRVAYTLLIDNTVDQAMTKIKQGILNLLEHLGAGPDKYNETITYAWLLLVKHKMEQSDPCDNFERFVTNNSDLLELEIMYTYYSRELLHSKKAKEYFVEPDIGEIPRYEK